MLHASFTHASRVSSWAESLCRPIIIVWPSRRMINHTTNSGDVRLLKNVMKPPSTVIFPSPPLQMHACGRNFSRRRISRPISGPISLHITVISSFALSCSRNISTSVSTLVWSTIYNLQITNSPFVSEYMSFATHPLGDVMKGTTWSRSP